MRMHVDKSGRDSQATRVNLRLCRRVDFANGRNPAVFYRHICEKTGVPRAVGDAPMPEEQIV